MPMASQPVSPAAWMMQFPTPQPRSRKTESGPRLVSVNTFERKGNKSSP